MPSSSESILLNASGTAMLLSADGQSLLAGPACPKIVQGFTCATPPVATKTWFRADDVDLSKIYKPGGTCLKFVDPPKCCPLPEGHTLVENAGTAYDTCAACPTSYCCPEGFHLEMDFVAHETGCTLHVDFSKPGPFYDSNGDETGVIHLNLYNAGGEGPPGDELGSEMPDESPWFGWGSDIQVCGSEFSAQPDGSWFTYPATGIFDRAVYTHDSCPPTGVEWHERSGPDMDGVYQKNCTFTVYCVPDEEGI